MDPLTQLFLIIGALVLITAAITAFLVKGKSLTITTVTIDAKNVYQRLAECAKLATAESEFSQVYRISEEKKYLWGLAKSTKDFEMDYTAKVVAGLDLTKSGLEIDVTHRKVYLNNPSCEVIATDLNLEKSKEYHGVFNQITTEDRDRYFKELKDHVRNVAIEKGLLLTAENKAIQSLSAICGSMGLSLIAGSKQIESEKSKYSTTVVANQITGSGDGQRFLSDS